MNEQTKNAEFIKMLGITLIPLHLFFTYYQLMRKTLNISFLDHVYLSLSSKLSMMNSSLLMNFLAMFVLLLYAITTPLGKDKELNKLEIVKKTGIGFLLILMSALIFMVLPYNQWGFYVYATGLGVGYYLYISNIAIMLQLVQMKKTKEFNFEKETFPQMINKIETEHSINIPYHFYYQEKWHKGWLNFVNPFRAILVAGSPGSGKSFGTINLAIN